MWHRLSAFTVACKTFVKVYKHLANLPFNPGDTIKLDIKVDIK